MSHQLVNGTAEEGWNEYATLTYSWSCV